MGLRATIEQSGDEVRSRGHRHWLRLTPDDAGGLRVEAAGWDHPGWDRVDGDLPGLVRALVRQVAQDVAAARELGRAATELAGVPARDPDPVGAVVRATFPLLASPEPWPLATIPDRLPPGRGAAFRCRDPRRAADRLFGDRATRPVARALAELLTDTQGVDVLVLSLAVAAAPVLEPDHLAAVLRAPRGAEVDRAPLDEASTARLARLLRDVPPRRALALLTAAAADDAERARLRFVATTCPPDVVPDLGTDWATAALSVLGALPAEG